jgi:hypothetical protein
MLDAQILQDDEIKNNFRLFRSTTDRKLFALHLVNKDESTKLIIQDGLTFEEAQDALEYYSKLTIVDIEEVIEYSKTFS